MSHVTASSNPESPRGDADMPGVQMSYVPTEFLPTELRLEYCSRIEFLSELAFMKTIGREASCFSNCISGSLGAHGDSRFKIIV